MHFELPSTKFPVEFGRSCIRFSVQRPDTNCCLSKFHSLPSGKLWDIILKYVPFHIPSNSSFEAITQFDVCS